MNILRITLRFEQVSFILALLDLLGVEQYSVFEKEDSESSAYTDSDDLPIAEFHIIECYLEKNTVNLLTKLFSKFNIQSEILKSLPKTKQEIEALEIGSFIITSSKTNNTQKKPIYMTASMAFGTGHHQTTKGCLLGLEKLKEISFSPKNILDLGCGSAILSIAAYKLFKDVNIIASDIDSVAIEIAKDNFKENNCDIKAIVSDGFNELPNGKCYDLIMANILLRPLCQLSGTIVKSLSKGGYLILSGIIESQLEECINCFSALKVIESRSIEGWIVVIMQS